MRNNMDKSKLEEIDIKEIEKIGEELAQLWDEFKNQLDEFENIIDRWATTLKKKMKKC
jgi:predicted nuclease with TOPRIM domain